MIKLKWSKPVWPTWDHLLFRSFDMFPVAEIKSVLASWIQLLLVFSCSRRSSCWSLFLLQNVWSCDSALLTLWPTFSFRHRRLSHFTASRLHTGWDLLYVTQLCSGSNTKRHVSDTEPTCTDPWTTDAVWRETQVQNRTEPNHTNVTDPLSVCPRCHRSVTTALMIMVLKLRQKHWGEGTFVEDRAATKKKVIWNLSLMWCSLSVGQMRSESHLQLFSGFWLWNLLSEVCVCVCVCHKSVCTVRSACS